LRFTGRRYDISATRSCGHTSTRRNRLFSWSKAGIKTLLPIVLFILPVLFIITLVPGMLSVLRDLKMGLGPRP